MKQKSENQDKAIPSSVQCNHERSVPPGYSCNMSSLTWPSCHLVCFFFFLMFFAFLGVGPLWPWVQVVLFRLKPNVLRKFDLAALVLEVLTATRRSTSNSKCRATPSKFLTLSLCVKLTCICSHELGRKRIIAWTCCSSVEVLSVDFNS